MDPNDWTLTGNAGTDPATNFLGTSDNQPLVIKTNGAERLRIDPAGKVGIGTTNPGAKLNVDLGTFLNTNPATAGMLISGDVTGNPGHAGYRITLNNTSGNYAGFVRAVRTADTTFIGLEIGSETNHGIRFLTNGIGDSAERMRIDATGNVGIGTTGPIAKLEIRRVDTTHEQAIRLSTSAGDDWKIYQPAATSDLRFWTDFLSTDILSLTSPGNVGIGTATPGSKLDVVQANSAAIRALSGDSNSNTSLSIGRTADEGRIGVAASFGQFADDASVGDIILRTETTTSRLLFGNGTGRSAMAIQNGNVGIGTTDPSTKLEVDGQIYINIIDAPPGTTTNLLSFLAGANGFQFHWGHFYLSPSSIDNRLYFGASNSPTANPPSPIMTWDVGTGNVGIGTANAGARLEVNGSCSVSGDILLTGNDCAEEFDIAEAVDIEPGTVMVIDQDGALHQSHHAYDKRVAGVVSGAGDYKPGLILDRRQSQDSRAPVALVGKVYCKVDAQYAPIEVGDLLTTSSTPGHAMKADPLKAFGSVIGKALRPLEAGQGMIPILIALQ